MRILLSFIVSLLPLWADSLRSFDVGFDAAIESIEFVDVAEARQRLVLQSLGVAVGDTLSVDARHRIGRALGSAQTSVAQKPLTFTYTPGDKTGTAKLIIRAGC